MSEDTKLGGKRERTREALIAATLAVIDEKGLSGASLEAIARRAGMTRGAIYSNFESRADLLLAAVSARALRIDRSFQPAETLKAQLRQFAEGLISQLPRAQGVSRWHAEFQLYSVTDPEMREKVAEVFRVGFADMSRNLDTQHRNLKLPARSLVLAIQAMAMGFLYQAILSPDEVRDADVIAAFEALADGAGG
jgi:AcrR family transcriptional regulator